MKMLMEIDPLPIGSLVMTMVMISPSRREVSPAEQLHRSPRLVPPRGGGVSSHEFANDFSSMKDFEHKDSVRLCKTNSTYYRRENNISTNLIC